MKIKRSNKHFQFNFLRTFHGVLTSSPKMFLNYLFYLIAGENRNI